MKHLLLCIGIVCTVSRCILASAEQEISSVVPDTPTKDTEPSIVHSSTSNDHVEVVPPSYHHDDETSITVSESIILSTTGTPSPAATVTFPTVPSPLPFDEPSSPFSSPVPSPEMISVTDSSVSLVTTLYRYTYCSYRGFLHALRDILFPEFRHNATLLANSYGKLDKGFEDESPEDYVLRLTMKNHLLYFADSLHIPEFYHIYPDTFRTLAAILVGILLFSTLICIKGVTECFTRACFRVLFKVTKNSVFEDTEILASGSTIDNNVFGRMWDGPVEYEFDPRLTEEQRKAFREHQQRIAKELVTGNSDKHTKKTQ